MAGKTALIAGASGLIGNELLHILLRDDTYARVVAVGRSKLAVEHPKLVQHQVDFDRLQDAESWLEADDVYCCLGTTIKKAGSQEAMRRIDVEYPLALAKLARIRGAQTLAVVSSIGADPAASSFYLRMKGELEEGLKALAYDALHIFQPSLLLGNRAEFRLGEKAAEILAKPLSAVLFGSMRKYRPIHARVVAAAMFRASQQPAQGAVTYTSDQIAQMGG
ncbi:oxidoreductase [Paenibacillus swuensis]|uniref:Oxidoreductase n=1 Tax=Paenibacillus swuensis TaxID=1178515 RepID=A0A172TF31_9BACL|nr:oxidoreductase [Paenibacillus swuensis]ANE45651.1 oxidoreductase [Paenibacillus swuensis]